MPPLPSRQLTGISLGLIGGVVISFDVPIIRMAGSDPWLMMLARGLIPLPVYLYILYALRRFHDTPHNPFASVTWVQVGIIYGVSQVFFSTSVFNTSTANLVFILAFNPLLAAILSWWMIGERPRTVTWIAIALTMIGVGIIVGGGLEAGTWFGDFCALGSSSNAGAGDHIEPQVTGRHVARAGFRRLDRGRVCLADRPVQLSGTG